MSKTLPPCRLCRLRPVRSEGIESEQVQSDPSGEVTAGKLDVPRPWDWAVMQPIGPGRELVAARSSQPWSGSQLGRKALDAEKPADQLAWTTYVQGGTNRDSPKRGGGKAKVLFMEQWQWSMWSTATVTGLRSEKEEGTSMYDLQQPWAPFRECLKKK